MDVGEEQGSKRGYAESEESGEFWKATAFDPQSKLQVARAVGKREQALLERVLTQVVQRVSGALSAASGAVKRPVAGL